MKEPSKQDFEDLGLSDDFFNQLEKGGYLEAPEVVKEIRKKLAELKKPAAKIAQAEQYIKDHYDIRLDIISNSIEARKLTTEINDKGEIIKTPATPWADFKVESLDAEFQRNNIVFSFGKLKNLIASDFVPEFNPFEAYFNNLPAHDVKTDPIEKLCSYIDIVGDKSRFILQLKKHLARTVACALNDGYFNKQIFVFIGAEQNSGKTSLIRWLVPPELRSYYQENPELDKDGLISITENLIINLDELDQLYRTAQKSMKSWISKDSVKARRPYAAKQERMSRRASFFGTSNEDDFLTDETGSVRYVVFRLNDKQNKEPINFKYSTELTQAEIWSQAMHLYNDKDFEYQLTKQEAAHNQRENEQFKHYTPEMDLVNKYFEPGSPEDYHHFFTTTEITELLLKESEKGLNLKSYNVGRALKSLHFEKLHVYSSNTQQSRPGYYVKERLKIVPEPAEPIEQNPEKLPF